MKRKGQDKKRWNFMLNNAQKKKRKRNKEEGEGKQSKINK